MQGLVDWNGVWFTLEEGGISADVGWYVTWYVHGSTYVKIYIDYLISTTDYGLST